MKTLLSLFIALLWIINAQANPVADLKLVGKTEINWMFWKIYDIQLLNSDGRFQRDKYPLALAIRYAREIESERLLGTTVDEWQRQDIAWKTDWKNQLDTLWPDVLPGDEIILRVDYNRHSHFFHNKRLLGSIEDAEFAPAFLAIWLSENTLKPEAQRQLTGTF